MTSGGSSPRAGRRLGDVADERHELGLIPASRETTRRLIRRSASRWAHPRERGDDPTPGGKVTYETGSSPRAGRRRRRDGLRAARRGLIPASGETTTLSRSVRGNPRAHPRERGDDAAALSVAAVGSGSSPRAGRRPTPVDVVDELPGLIPASGETTPRARHRRCTPGAHPRERGDDRSVSARPDGWDGSSPRAGRRPGRDDRAEALHGLIPASGETTGVGARGGGWRTAHPRERGDDLATKSDRDTVEGSSPRAGRRPVGCGSGVHDTGFIPASGETTRTPSTASRTRPAHPRERGDDHPALDLSASVAGSSPRAGRRRVELGVGAGGVRLIPASGETTVTTRRSSGGDAGSSPRAGRRHADHGIRRDGSGLIPASGETTVRICGSACSTAAHPRERGDDADAEPRSPEIAGSSPRAGRRRFLRCRRRAVHRLIPASGETTKPRPCRTRRRRAHPRERGDDKHGISDEDADLGSSPRAGRRRQEELPDGRLDGLIPVSGETTGRRRRPCARSWAHPRERGDDSSHGLSSAVRGGLIPASGETTTPRPCRTRRRRAHPRERGDDRGPPAGHFPSAGSSPRAREPRR